MTLSTNQTFARLPEGDFITRIAYGNVGFTASPRLSFSNLIIHPSNRSRNLGWQSRIRWTLQPGNDVFFAFNQGWLQEESDNRVMRFRLQDSRVSAKFQVLVQVLMRSLVPLVLVMVFPACAAAPEPPNPAPPAASPAANRQLWIVDRDGQHDARVRQRIGVVSHRLEGNQPEPWRGGISADPAQRHQRPALENHRVAAGNRVRKRGIWR